MRPVVVLRPEPASAATVARARELGLEAIAIPLFAIRPVEWAPPAGRFDGLLLTSANAIREAGEPLAAVRHLPAYAVGRATADAAIMAGLNVRQVGDGGVDRLLASLPTDLRLLHLCGEERRAPRQEAAGIVAVPVYRAKPLPAPDLTPLRGAVALVHSPRAGARLGELMERRSETAVAAISPAAASECGGGWAALEAAEAPNDEALLSLAARLCQHSAP